MVQGYAAVLTINGTTNLNTSHVMVQETEYHGLGLAYLHLNTSHVMVQDKDSDLANMSIKFKYISCYGSRLLLLHVFFQLGHLNTSHVMVQVSL